MSVFVISFLVFAAEVFFYRKCIPTGPLTLYIYICIYIFMPIFIYLAIPVGDAIWDCPRSFFFLFFLFFPPRFCPGHISGTVTRRDSKLSVLLGPAV